MSRDPSLPSASRSGRWLKRLGLTLSASAVLTGLYSIYALILRPMVQTPGLERPANIVAASFASGAPGQREDLANRYLPLLPWAADAQYFLRTEEAYIYFEHWEPLEDKEAARFTPFAMIWMPKDRKPDEEPITIISDSAYVRFARKFEYTSPNAGRVVAGALEGAVQIAGDNGLKIVGRNFVFSEKQMRIWTDTHVDIAYGPHYGNGQGLEIDLIPDEVARAKDKLAVKGVKAIGLRRNVSMDMEFLQSKPTLAAQDTDPFAVKKESDSDKEPTIVKIRSAGSFKFVMATNIATFEDEVRVYQPTEPGKYNSLQSDLLTLYFEPKPKNPAQAKADSEDSFQSVDANLTFRKLIALGQNVILRSETNDLIAMMHHLDYDAKTRLARMTSRQAVRVLQEQSELQCPKIELLHQQGGRVSHLWAKGAGWLQSVDEQTGKLAFAAQWKKELRKRPDPKTGLDWFELEGQALVRQPADQIGLAAESMRLWMLPEEKSSSRSDRSRRMRPEKLLALNNVAIVSPDMQGQSQRLEVFFEPAPAGRRHTEGKRSRDHLKAAVKQVPGGPNVIPASRSRTKGENLPLAPPAGEESLSSEAKSSDTGTGESSDKKPTDGPIELVADLIQVRIFTYPDGQSSEVAEVRTEGRVVVGQSHGEEESPLKMLGDKLHVVNQANDNQIMTLWGSPAHIYDRGMHIEGREIFLDRENNESRVNGAGLLQLPVKRSLDGEELQEPTVLDIWWAENMTFDGLHAKFFGNVRAVFNNDGLRSNMRCEEMDVVLSERISFQQSRSPQSGARPNADIARVFCKDGVEFDSYKYEETVMTEIRRGRFGEFSVNQITGDTKGQGPGWIKVWRRGRGKRASLTPSASVKANRALKPDATEWEYMRIDFAGISEGNLKQRFNTFKEDVNIIYGPVERSLMVIELDNLPKDAGWMRCENLRITQNEPAEKDQPGHVELLATGNVDLAGREFNARADSISYDESKGLYTLRSQGRHEATIWRQTQLGGERSRVDARLMHFAPARNFFSFDRAISVDGVN